MKSKFEKMKILAFLLNEYSCLHIMTWLMDNFKNLERKIGGFSPFSHQVRIQEIYV